MIEKQDISFAALNIRSLIVDTNAFQGYLQEIYADLCTRYSSSLDLRTFQSYMCLPMLISEKIFRALDSECKNRLVREQFVEGLSDLYIGNPIRKLDLVFDVFDFDKDGVICEEDTRVLLSQFHMMNGSQGLQTLEDIIKEAFAEKASIQKEQLQVFSDISFLFIFFLNAYKPFHVGSVNYYKNLNCINQNMLTNSDNFLYVPKKEHKRSIFCSAQVNRNELNVTLESFMAEPSEKAKKYLKDKLNVPSTSGSEEKDDSIIKDLEILDDFEFDKETALQVEDCGILGTVPQYASHQLKTRLNIITSNMSSRGKILAACQTNNKSKETTTDSVESHRLINNISQNNSNQIPKSPVLGNISGKSSCCCISESSPQIACDQESQNIWEIIVHIQDVSDITRLSRNKFILVNDDIFWFKLSKNNWIFHKIIHIKASFFDKCEPVEILGKTYFPFQICIDFRSTSCPPFDVFCDDKKEMFDFVSRCQEATRIQRISNFYDLKEDIGNGHFATVKLGISKLTNQKVAVKILPKTKIKKGNIQMVMHEIDIFKFLMKVTHNNIVKAIDYFETSSMIYFVYEYVPGGNLNKYLFTKTEIFQENELMELLSQIGDAIKFLHYFGILHRDIKPDNILVDRKLDNSIQLKLSDFGLSKVMGLNDKTLESYGSLCYAAPEILLNLPYNHKVDVWSFGVLAYYLSFLVLPFDDSSSNLKAIRDKIIKGKENYDFTLKYSYKFEMVLKKVISMCLIKDLQKRISMRKVMKQIYV